MAVVVTGEGLTLDEVLRVARAREGVRLAPEAVERVRRGREVVDRHLAGGKSVYGLNTGVGVRERLARSAVHLRQRPEDERILEVARRIVPERAAGEQRAQAPERLLQSRVRAVDADRRVEDAQVRGERIEVEGARSLERVE